MRRITKPLGFVAKATRSPKAETRPVVVASTYSSMSPPPREKEDTEELAMPELEFIPFPGHIPGGMVVRSEDKTETGKNRDKSSSGQEQGTNGGGKSDYGGGCSGCPGCGDGKGTAGGGGCSGCPGCTRCGCPGCSGGCDICFSCDGCTY